jgi:radical SAM protein (TIGR01212 family)
LASTKFGQLPTPSLGWRSAGLRYHSLGWFLRQKFGCRVWKVSVDAGFTCPNVDGAVGTGGCVFCNIRSFSPSRRLEIPSITGQIEEGVRRVRRKDGPERFLAYFQPASNTYAPVERLRAVYEEALSHPLVVGLTIGTRPDCVSDGVLDLAAELASRTWIVMEYGLQTIHEKSLAWLNRGHTYAAFQDAAQRTRRRGIPFGAHVILGLPGETRQDMLATARALAESGVHSVKLHNLYAVRDTLLAEWVRDGKVRLLERGEYADCVVDFLEALPPHCVVDRLSGEAPREYLVAPEWTADKGAVRADVEAEFARRNSWQGKASQT